MTNDSRGSPPTLPVNGRTDPLPAPAAPDLLDLSARARGLGRLQLLELLRDDQSCRWQRGERVWVETYLHHAPDLRADEEGILDLLYSEILLREEQGETAEPQEYLRRFPQYATQIQRQLTLHRLLQECRQDLTDSDPPCPSRATPVAPAPAGTRLVLDPPAASTGTGPTATQAAFARTLPLGAPLGPGEARRPDDSRPAPAGPLPTVPGYEILEELGRGGMGVVYKARQLGLERVVALKMILTGEFADPGQLLPLRSEAVKLASLQHPNIVQVHDVGEHEGRPYFSMEYVAGGSLARRWTGLPQLPDRVVPLLEELANAIHCVHQQGIVHRDLKPGNILLACRPGTPVEQCTPKISDFGLARSLGSRAGEGVTGLSLEKGCLGTPPYMAPEQAAGETRAIGPATDVYALGAMLYEALTGRPPFLGATPMGTLLRVLNEDPVPPSRLQPKVPRELEAICLKCLEKDPAHRYASARELAEDLRRFRVGEPVRARPVSAWRAASKWARRRPAVAALMVVATLVTVVGVVLVTLKGWEAEVARGQAERAFRAAQAEKARAEAALEWAESSLYLNHLALAEREWLANRVGRADAVLDECQPGRRGWEWRYLKRLCHADQFTLRGHEKSVLSVAWSPDGRRLASAGEDQIIRLWDADTGRLTGTLPGHKGWVYSLCFSPDGKRLASGSRDNMIRVWDADSGRVLLTLEGHTGDVLGVAYSPDGKRLASASEDRTVMVWDAADGRPLLTLRGAGDAVTSVAFNPADPRQLASGSDDKTVRLWDLETGKETFRLNHTDSATAVAFNQEGKRLAATSQEGTVKVWDSASGQETVVLRGHATPAYGVAFRPGGDQFVTAGADQTLRIWDASTGQEVGTLRGHLYAVLAAAFSPDGQRIVSGSGDRTVKVWNVATGQEAVTLRGHSNGVYGVAFCPDGRTVVSSSGEPPDRGEVKCWDVASGKTLLTFRGHHDLVYAVAVSPDGRWVASGCGDQTVKVWDVRTGQERLTLSGHRAAVYAVAFRADGRRIASAGEDQTIKVWDAETGRELLTLRGHTESVLGVAFSPDGSRLASAGADQTARVWDAATGKELLTLKGHPRVVYGLAWSPDGKRIATASEDQTVKLWDAFTGNEMTTLRGHSEPVTAVAFSPDGSRLVSASDDQTIKIWDPAAGQEVFALRGHTDHVTGVAFSADGRRLASGSWDKTVKVWEAPVPVQPPEVAPGAGQGGGERPAGSSKRAIAPGRRAFACSPRLP